ncbi:MAG: 16S rRNA (uracil(1498)-N(3))-methyltransferase [Treponema sp.]|jgi:RsmE family RNA methyltransferase|nr:16S rRNA (uracil(1498)-N(3))-methyltransferase [Treponema sp.]
MNIILFEPSEAGAPLIKQDARTVHILKTLHKKAGDKFTAGILEGRTGIGRIESIEPNGVLRYTLDLREDPPPRLPIRMAVGFPRPIQLRRILRDLSNLGIEAIDLLGTDMGEKSYRDANFLNNGGARTAMIEGAVQARDTRLPALRVFRDLSSWLMERPWEAAADWNGQAALIAADNVRPHGGFACAAPENRPLVIAVGPERGWSEWERGLLNDAGFLRLSMGQRALRTETACIAAAILAMEKIGVLE